MLNLRGRDIVDLLRNNDKAIGRGLAVLYRRQTMDEQSTFRSRHTNDMGFNKADAHKGTEHALFFMKNGYLTNEMIAYWREPIKRTNGRPTFRIAIYWKQLLNEAYRNYHNAERKAA